MLFNGAGFYLYYVAKLQQIRSEMREALKSLPESELNVLKMSMAQFLEATVDEHEIKVKGRMYDIARIVISKNSVTVYGKHDEKEDNLIALLDHFITAPLKEKDVSHSAATSLLLLTFIEPARLSLFFPRGYRLQLVPKYLFTIKTFKPAPEGPPPRSLPSLQGL